jgi:TPR repeat protein
MNIQDLRRKAESGNVAAQSILGACYLEGFETDVDYPGSFDSAQDDK